MTELTSESFKKEILNLSLRDILKKKLEQDCFGNILSMIVSQDTSKYLGLYVLKVVYASSMDRFKKKLNKYDQLFKKKFNVLYDQPLREILKDLCKKLPENFLAFTVKEALALQSLNQIEKEFKKDNTEVEMINSLEQFHQLRDSEQVDLFMRIQDLHLQRLGIDDFQNVTTYEWR